MSLKKIALKDYLHMVVNSIFNNTNKTAVSFLKDVNGDYHRINSVDLLRDRIQCEDGYWDCYDWIKCLEDKLFIETEEIIKDDEDHKTTSVSKLKISIVEDIVECILDDIKCGNNTNSHNERTSSYYSIIEDENENSISIQVSEEKDGLEPDDYFYSIHVIDDITKKYCELYNTRDTEKDSLKKLVYEISMTYQYALHEYYLER